MFGCGSATSTMMTMKYYKESAVGKHRISFCITYFSSKRVIVCNKDMIRVSFEQKMFQV